ncbi:MAG: ImmA/IrrE family metallo-endopeptidase [Ruminococcus sp.]|nr:ImmA/IrrE family metallo-endopeptidase [Ruminococcus sp.]
MLNYAIYKNARNASWQCFIDCSINELPIKPIRIAIHYGIICKQSDKESLFGADGEIVRNNSEIFIRTDADQPIQRRRYTIMHEIGHYLLGHLGDMPLSRSERDCKPEEEQAADRFAADILMPACVLWGLNIHTPEEIARLCNVSMSAATIRAERMEVLYQRNKFLLHPLERQVYVQFSEFIQKHKH